MILSDKEPNALRSINAVLVLARAMASEGRTQELAVVLDIAEYLPLLMLDSSDKTNEFRAQLTDLAERFPQFGVALERFDKAQGSR